MTQNTWQRRATAVVVGAVALATLTTSGIALMDHSLLAPGAAAVGRAEVTPDPDLVVGADPAEPRRIGGETGQDLATNISPTDAETVGSTTVARTLWWSWRATASGPVVFSTVGSEVDTAITVREGSSTGPVVATGTDAGDLVTAETTVDAVEGTTYVVEVAAEEEVPQAGLVVLGWQPVVAPAAVQEPEATTPVYTANEIPLTGTTGEKPQSKLFSAHGTWWAVAASTSTNPTGTWLWRRDGQAWSAVLRLSDRTDVRADTLQVGDDVVHVLLHGPVTTLVSLQYSAAGSTYVPWTQRPAPTTISLPGSETATIDVDGTGRIWLATENATQVYVRWADAPYTTFSDPVVVASGISDDDISVVTAIPGGVGVLWSNQNTHLFGFRTHLDGTAPNVWTADESPASGSAQNVGDGFSDDHLNIATAADGTLYAAVKTSYDTKGSTVIGLLVRSPAGVWDQMHPVDTRGTRPNVEIDEATGMLRVVYTETEYLSNIIEKVVPLDELDFSAPATVVLPGGFNNVTSSKRSVPGATLAVAGGATRTGTARLSWTPPGAPTVADLTLATTKGTAVSGTLSTAPSTVDVYEVVSEPTSGTLVLNATTGAVTYTPDPAFVGTDHATVRVRKGELWSAPSLVTFGVTSEAGLVGRWDLDEAAGARAADTSGWGGHGVVSGGATWTPGTQGSGLLLDGLSGLATVPDSDALDVSGALTVAAWVRPEKVDTQYVVKKADVGADGFELASTRPVGRTCASTRRRRGTRIASRRRPRRSPTDPVGSTSRAPTTEPPCVCTWTASRWPRRPDRPRSRPTPCRSRSAVR